MAETDWHRALTVDLIDRLGYWYADDPDTYVSGDLLVFYEKGNRRKHIAPDVFVVPGATKKRRPHYLTWRERRRLAVVIEVTSTSTRHVDLGRKFALYRDVLKVREYFLFDPFGDYLTPPLQGHRLIRGSYVPIAPTDDRLPSEVLSLHLEPRGNDLLLRDPASGRYIPTAAERAEQERRRAEEAHHLAETAAEEAARAQRRAEQAERENAELLAQIERLRRENERSRRKDA